MLNPSGRWSLKLQQFVFDIVCRKGALSGAFKDFTDGVSVPAEVCLVLINLNESDVSYRVKNPKSAR